MSENKDDKQLNNISTNVKTITPKPHYTCPKCGTYMSKRNGPYGKYRFCKGCRYTYSGW